MVREFQSDAKKRTNYHKKFANSSLLLYNIVYKYTTSYRKITVTNIIYYKTYYDTCHKQISVYFNISQNY